MALRGCWETKRKRRGLCCRGVEGMLRFGAADLRFSVGQVDGPSGPKLAGSGDSGESPVHRLYRWSSDRREGWWRLGVFGHSRV
jgi:hypothetical protein